MPRRPNPKNVPGKLFEETDTAVYILDQQRTLVYLNPAFANLLNQTQEDLIGKQLVYQADKPDSASSFCPPLQLLKPTSSQQPSNPSDWFDVAYSGQQYTVQLIPLKENEELVWAAFVGPEKDRSREPDSEWFHQLVQQFRTSQNQRFSQIPFLGVSSLARSCFEKAKSFALSTANVLVKGHPGSQFLDVAKAIFYAGFQGSETGLLPIDCKVIDGDRVIDIIKDLLENEPNDEEPGIRTLLLIQVEHLDQTGQKGLLDLLEQQRQSSLRIISTSAEDLFQLEEFDTELALQLSTLDLTIPQLSKRVADIPLLAQVVLERLQVEWRCELELGEDLCDALKLYPWRDDYRELKTLIELVGQKKKTGVIDVSCCPDDFRLALKAAANPIERQQPIQLDQFLSDVENDLIQRAIQASNGNKSKAAQLLGISRARLHRKLDDNTSQSDEP